MSFVPDYRYMLDVLGNRRPARLPLYEHIICPEIMEKILGVSFTGLLHGGPSDRLEFARLFCKFFKEMTYDTVSFEVCITEILPDHGAIMGGRPGPIQNRRDFEAYPWERLPEIYWELAAKQFDAIAAALPPGMKALGGIGNGVLEISEDLVGYEYLAYLQADDPELFADLYVKIGDLMSALWRRFLERYSESFAICRFGDDLGFRSACLVAPDTIRAHILPQYKRVIGIIKDAGKPFLWHSCGCIFEIMDEVIALGIDAKHSNEDAIAPFERWIEGYGKRIGLLGGIDLDILCQKTPEEIYATVLERGRRFRALAQGYALGSGNSIPDYVPVEGYLAMVRAGQTLREEEGNQ
jgi:uroporphyrinogen decarboxylase